jgi:hypothetical protein
MKALRPRLAQIGTVLALALGGDAAAASHAPPAFPPYPAVRSLPAVADWAQRYSDLPLATIVGVGADSVFAVERTADQPMPPFVRVVIRQEAVTPEFSKRLGGRSAAMTVDIDCEGRRVFQRAVFLYVGSNRQGPSRELGAAKDWQAIPPGTYMERVRVAVCDPNWRPLYTSGVLMAPPGPSQSAPRPQAPIPARPALAPGRADLGRFDSADAALAAWGKAGSAAAGRQLRMELSTAGGRTLYRALVEGFASRDETDAFCRKLQAAGAQCAVVD